MTAVFGVHRGIERLSTCLMPIFFLLMIGLAAYSLLLPGSEAGLAYLFQFSWSTVTPQAILNAMGFTFFSLSLGAGVLVTYGAYVNKSTRLPAAAMWVAILALQAAILAGLVIMPAVFAYGLEPDAGPGLVFITLPMIFAQLSGGSVVAVIFYFCLFVAALTSAVSLLEVAVRLLQTNAGSLVEPPFFSALLRSLFWAPFRRFPLAPGATASFSGAASLTFSTTSAQTS